MMKRARLKFSDPVIELLYTLKKIDCEFQLLILHTSNPIALTKIQITTMTDVKFCKFCFDSGKEEALYSNHYVKETKGGKPCCPTLAATMCGYCKTLGHTPKHCPRLASRAARLVVHEQRLARRNSLLAKQADAPSAKPRQTAEQAACQKRDRLRLDDDQYAARVGAVLTVGEPSDVPPPRPSLQAREQTVAGSAMMPSQRALAAERLAS